MIHDGAIWGSRGCHFFFRDDRANDLPNASMCVAIASGMLAAGFSRDSAVPVGRRSLAVPPVEPVGIVGASVEPS